MEETLHETNANVLKQWHGERERTLNVIPLHTLCLVDTEASLLAFLSFNSNLEEWNYNAFWYLQSHDDPCMTHVLLCITLLFFFFFVGQWLMLNALEMVLCFFGSHFQAHWHCEQVLGHGVA